MVLCLCSEADAFVAASYATMRPAAKVAFLVLGPMLDFKLYFMYTRVFRPRLIWTIFLSVIVQTFLYSYAVHVIWETTAETCSPSQPPRRRRGTLADRIPIFGDLSWAAHDHITATATPFYMEQLFTIGVCGALAGVTLLLWYGGTLKNMLAAKFHIWVFLGGAALLAHVSRQRRGRLVLRRRRKAAPAQSHGHESRS